MDDLLDLGGEVTPSQGVKTEQSPESVGAKEQASVANSSNWLEGLDETLRTEPTLSRFEDIGTLAKSYVELRKQMGKSPYPNEKSTEEEIQEFYRKAGIPDKDNYKLDADKYGLDKELAGQLKEIAATTGITEHGLSKVFDFLQEKEQEGRTIAQGERQAILEEQVSGLKKEYGDAFDKYKKLGTEVAKEIYSPEEIASLKEEGFFSHPMVAKLLMSQAKSKYGEELISDEHTKQNFVVTPDQAKTRISEILSDSDYHTRTSPRHKTLVKEMEKLHLVLASS